jgi:hypothetical protein
LHFIMKFVWSIELSFSIWKSTIAIYIKTMHLIYDWCFFQQTRINRSNRIRLLILSSIDIIHYHISTRFIHDLLYFRCVRFDCKRENDLSNVYISLQSTCKSENAFLSRLWTLRTNSLTLTISKNEASI